MEASILGPEEEPDGSKDKGKAYQSKEDEETDVVDVLRVKDSVARAIGGRGSQVSDLELVGDIKGRKGRWLTSRRELAH